MPSNPAPTSGYDADNPLVVEIAETDDELGNLIDADDDLKTDLADYVTDDSDASGLRYTVVGSTVFDTDGSKLIVTGDVSDSEQKPGTGAEEDDEDTINVDETVTRVAGAGGQVYMEPYDVLEAGRMAIFAEPTGAVAALWQNRRGTGGTLTGEPNSLCWAELLSDDPDKATKFFKDVLGVESGSMPGPGGNPYILLKAAGKEVAGIFRKPSEMPAEVPSFWLNYFAVADCDATVEKAKSLGGTALAEPMEPMPGMRLAVLMDPQGASFGVINENAPA